MRKWPCYAILALVLTISTTWATVYEGSCDETRIENCNACQDPSPICSEYGCTSNTIISRDQSKCMRCPDNCDSCVETSAGGATECATCGEGFYVDDDKECGACAIHCEECDKPGKPHYEPDCTKCQEGYFEANEYTCQACGGNCLMCDDSSKCTTCRNSFYLDGGECQPCPGGSDCVDCTTSKSQKCDICSNRKYWDPASSTCSNCLSHCAECSDGDTCEECDDGYFVSQDGSACLSAQNCAEYEDNTGCSSCEAGYRKQTSDDTCYECPTYTTGNCDSCHLENGRGRFFDETRQFCSYCMDNCDSCTDSDTCDEAVDGYIVDTRDSDDATAGVQHSCITCDSIPVVGGDWNSHHDLSTPEGRNRKMDDCHNCGRYVVDDDPTDEVVRCEECPTPIVLDDLSTSEKCEYCKEENTGHYYATGVCAVVDCSREISTISEAECGVCPEKYWDGTVCTDSNCAQAADQITDQAQCQSCSEKYWREPYCRVLARRECDASIGTDHLCSACSAHRWDSTDNMCKGVDCENADEDACQYCVGKWWINGECVDACDGSVTIDDMQWCHNCPGKLWDASGNGGSGSCDDISTECDDLNTVADADHCYACGMRGVAETSWDGTTCAAYSCDGQALDNEQACRACRRFVKVWNNDQCEAVDCDGPPSTEVPCEACQGHYWDGSCQTVDCSTLDLSTVTSEDMCRACAHERASWDGSACVQLQSGCETASDYTTLNDCLTCPATYFVAGTCNELDCTTFGSLVPEACSRCPGAAIVDNTCAIVDCSGDLTEEDQCKACSDKFWESGECKDRNNYCNDGIIHDDNRCEQCSVNDEFRLWVPENQPDDPGKCYACPDDCVRCNHEACTQCVTGKTWDGSMCVECSTSINNENMCGGCDGYVWEGGSACNKCPEYCLSCTQGATCDICMAGMIWDPSVGACVDCVLDQEEECMTCSIYSGTQAANYLDSEGLCRRCPDGCTACVEQNEECSECASNFYLEATSVAGVSDPVNRCHACTDTLDSSEKCSVCRGDSWYWNSDESSCNECGMGGCLKCDTADVCEQCPSGMWFDQQATSCQACGMNGCESCSSGTVCDQCPAGRWFDDSTPDAPTCRDVVPCSNCRTCSNVGECTECNEGYRVVDGTCVACTDTNCAKCVLDGDQEKCTKCKSSACTDDSGDSTYVQCMETTGPCRGGYCKIDATGYSCLSFDCGTGNYLEVCQKCTAMDCSECDPDDPTMCVTCSEGYRKDSNGDCKSCDEACTTCTTECQCRENQFWDAAADAFQCRDCRSGCKTCNNADACLTCPEGYYQTLDGQNNICKPCSQDIANCVKCLESSGEVQCEKCAGNAYLDGNECKPCSDIDAQCIRCEKDDAGVPVCRECNSNGFYYSKENAECRSCSADFPNCRTCGDKDGDGVIGAGECSTCQSGYVRKDDEESCAVCSISDCYECKDPKPQCTECASGFVATETKEQCAHTCYTCLDDGEGNCKEPVKGNSSETITCPGLGQDYACWSIYHKEGEVEKYTRSCSNETCTDEKKKWGCETARDTKRCRQCCTGDKCNIIEIRTGLGGAERHQVLSRTLICVIAVLSILFFH